VEADPVQLVDPSGEFANVVVGGGVSILTGWAISQLTGECYSWENALVDGATGAVGVGLFNKFRTLYRVAKLRGFAKANGLTPAKAQKGVEALSGSGMKLEIKSVGNMWNPHSGTINPQGSWFPRARLQVAPGNANNTPKQFWDPFSGKYGPLKSDAAHIPLQATVGESAFIGGATGASHGACGCP
jgi:hypothetical protein